MLRPTCFSNLVATTVVAMTLVGHTSEKATPSKSTWSAAALLETEPSTEVLHVHSLRRSSMQTHMCSNHNWLPLHIQTREKLAMACTHLSSAFRLALQKLPHIRSCLKNTVLCRVLADKQKNNNKKKTFWES